MKHLKTFYIFALTSISFKDFTLIFKIYNWLVLYDVPYFNKRFFMFGLFSCLNVDSLPVNFISVNEDFFIRLRG